MNRYYKSHVAMICLDGIRYIQMLNDRYSDGFLLQVKYKGDMINIKYPSKETLEKEFNAVCSELEKRRIGKRQE